MSSSNNTGQSGGLGLAGVLAAIFVTLKLTGNIGWSWWWVLSPVWISAAIAVLALLVVGGVALIAGGRSTRRSGR